MNDSVLSIEELRVCVPNQGRPLTLLDGVSYEVAPGEVFGLAGESGSGKTLSTLAVAGLLPQGATVSGKVMLNGEDVLALKPRRLRERAGREVGMVFQNPTSALHPMLTVGLQLTEHVRRHLGFTKQESIARAVERLEEVRIPDPEGALRAFPHQFSGGMRQRIAIAMALACDPPVLIADEPTTALDVTVQAGILRLLDRLRAEKHLAVLLITHDLGVLSSIADRLTVLYAGRIVESGSRSQILQRPRHPYTRALLDALPHPGEEWRELPSIPGTPAAPGRWPAGCVFSPRCSHATDECVAHRPVLTEHGGRDLACFVDPFAGGNGRSS